LKFSYILACPTGHQLHPDGNCYAHLNENQKTCNVADLEFMDRFVGKKCKESINVNGRCKIQCLFDKKGRTKDLPKSIWISCVKAVNPSGDVIGSHFFYGKRGYEFIDSLCGIGKISKS